MAYTLPTYGAIPFVSIILSLCNQTLIWHVVWPDHALLIRFTFAGYIASIHAPRSSNKFLQWGLLSLQSVCFLVAGAGAVAVVVFFVAVAVAVGLFMLFRKVKLHICFYYNKCQFSCLQFNYVSTVKISLLVFAFFSSTAVVVAVAVQNVQFPRVSWAHNLRLMITAWKTWASCINAWISGQGDSLDLCITKA